MTDVGASKALLGAVAPAAGKLPKNKVLREANISKEGAYYSRVFDFLVVAAVVTLFAGAIHLHVMLTVGDWDMFVDWKDRQYWPLLTPISMIMLPAALQAIFWTFFRLPIGATVGAVVLFIATWITRYTAWMIWTDFPFSMVVPSQILTTAIMMDCALIVLRNALFTSVFGGFAFGFFFYASNQAILMPYYMPIEHQGMVASVADMIGYVYPRSAMPEYLRIIERGTLRTFGSGVSWVSAAFAGFVCIFMHMLWWKIGLFGASVTYVKNGAFVQSMMGMKPTQNQP
jgi:methane/ammonia monooxygenase subunit A